MGFYRQENWSGLPCPPPGGLPDPGIKPMSLMSPALAGGLFTSSATILQIKTTMSYLLTAVKMAIIKKDNKLQTLVRM